MRIWIFVFCIAFASSCEKRSNFVDAKVRKVVAHYQGDHIACVNRGDFPNISFNILLRNLCNVSETVYIKNYGRASVLKSGSFWLHYNRSDSAELFSASCQYCYDSVRIAPNDSISIILETEYAKLLEESDSHVKVDSLIDKMLLTWEVIKYLDYKGNLIFYASKESQVNN